jgi:hypothetical protein
MDPLSVIISALVAGTAKTAGHVAQDTYEGLKNLIKSKFQAHGKSDTAVLLEKYKQDPEKIKQLLHKELSEIRADEDGEILTVAQQVLDQLEPHTAAEGQTVIQISGGTVQGVVLDNRGTIFQTFHESREPDHGE